MRLTFFLFFLMNCAYAQNCNFTISVNNFIGHIQSNEQSQPHPLTISRSNNSSNCQNIRAYFEKGNANSYNRKAFSGSKSISYNIYKESGLNTILKAQGDAGAGEYLSGNLTNNHIPYNFDFYLKLIDLDSVFNQGPGYYNDLIPIQVYAVKTNGTEEYQQTVYMNITIIIPRFAELSLGPENAPHDPSQTQHVLFFGNLTSNDEKIASLNVKGNVPFGIYMSSMNGSRLMKNSSSIAYQIKVGNTSYMSLANPGQSYYITQRNSGTPQSAINYPIRVKIGNVPSNAETGEYQDAITVTVTAW